MHERKTLPKKSLEFQHLILSNNYFNPVGWEFWKKIIHRYSEYRKRDHAGLCKERNPILKED